MKIVKDQNKENKEREQQNNQQLNEEIQTLDLD